MLKLRLSMGGTKKRPVYKIVVAESRFARDGRFIEKLGFFNPLLPKEKEDRIRLEPEGGESKGFEIYVKKDNGGRFSWWGSYGYAVAEDKVEGKMIPREFDQRHTVYLDVNYRPNLKWCINAAWQYHSGWPHTKPRSVITRWYGDFKYDIDWEPGPLRAERYPSYHRLDLRVSRYFTFSRGRISAFFELRNVYNRKNVREYNYYHAGIFGGQTVVRRHTFEDWLPILPSFGVIWEF